MATVGELLIRLGLDNRALALGLAESKGELAGFSTEVGKQSNAAASGFKAIQIAGAAVAVGAGAIAVESIHAASEFQEAMTTIALNARIPESAIGALSFAIENAAIGTTSSSLEMARALGPVAAEFERTTGQALNAADALLLLRAAESLHVAASTDLTTATKSITDLLLTYHLRASDAAGISDLLFAAQAQLGVGVDFVSGALQKLQPRIVGSGITLEQMLAIAREMEPVVGTGQRAILKLGSVLQSLLSPSSSAEKAFVALGIGTRSIISSSVTAAASSEQVQRAREALTVAELRLAELQGKSSVSSATLVAAQFRVSDASARLNDLLNQGGQVVNKYGVTLTDASGKFIGFGAAIDQINKALTNLTPAERSAAIYAIFGKNANIATELLKQGSAGLNANVAALNAQGSAADAAAQKNADLANQGRILRKDLEDMVASIGGAFLPILSRLEASLIPIINRFAAWISANPQLASNILLVVGAVGLLLAATAYLGPAIALLAGPFGLVAAAVVGLGVAWAANWGGMRDIVSSVIAQVGPTIAGIVAFISTIAGALTSTTPSVAELKEGFVGNLSPIVSIVQQVRDVVVTAFNFIGTNIVPAIGQALNWLATNVLPPLGEAFGAVAGWVRDNWGPISSIVTQVGGAIRTAFLVIINVLQFVWPILVAIARVVFPLIGAAAAVLLRSIDLAFKAMGVIWQTASTTVQSVAKAIGDAWGVLAGVFTFVRDTFINTMADMVHTALSGVVTILNILAAVPGPQQALLKQTAAFYETLLNPAQPGVTPVGAGGANIAHGGIGVGAATTPLPAATAAILGGGKPLVYQHGGVVPGVGPMLAIVHGGETVTPAGQGAQVIELHSHLSIGESELGEVIERFLVRMAGVYSSGFAANNPVTGA